MTDETGKYFIFISGLTSLEGFFIRPSSLISWVVVESASAVMRHQTGVVDILD
jgi:hypothetical protein